MIDRHKIGSLADAIAHANQYQSTEGQAYKHRNPGLLKVKKNTPLRDFTCSVDGLKALMDVLEKQCSRNPNHTLSMMLEELEVHCDQAVLIDYLDDDLLESRLTYFAEGK